MQYSEYDEQYTIGSLRRRLYELGGTPRNKNKQELITEIIKIENGELTVTHSKRGRPSKKQVIVPLYQFTPFAVLHDVMPTFESDEVSGMVELTNKGYGVLRVENYYVSKNDLMIEKDVLREYNLHNGDYIVCKIEKGFGGYYIEEVIAINGKEPAYIDRCDFNDLPAYYPNKKIMLDGNFALRLANIVCPIGKGQRGIILTKDKSQGLDFLIKTAKSVENDDIECFMLLIDTPEEDLNYVESQVNCQVISTRLGDSGEYVIHTAELLLNRCKNLVASGKDVILLVDSANGLINSYANFINKDEFSTKAIEYTKQFLSNARNVNEGSLTILITGTYGADNGSLMQIVDICNSTITLKGVVGDVSIDIARSLTERAGLLLNSDEQNELNLIREKFETEGEKASLDFAKKDIIE